MLISQSAGKFLKRKSKFNIGNEEIDLTIPIVMGIVNVTPDSFYDGGKMEDENVLLASVEKWSKMVFLFLTLAEFQQNRARKWFPPKQNWNG
jgi:hypothetical protein